MPYLWGCAYLSCFEGMGAYLPMQERYLGDSHDFLKYALLQHLSRNLQV